MKSNEGERGRGTGVGEKSRPPAGFASRRLPTAASGGQQSVGQRHGGIQWHRELLDTLPLALDGARLRAFRVELSARSTFSWPRVKLIRLPFLRSVLRAPSDVSSRLAFHVPGWPETPGDFIHSARTSRGRGYEGTTLYSTMHTSVWHSCDDREALHVACASTPGPGRPTPHNRRAVHSAKFAPKGELRAWGMCCGNSSWEWRRQLGLCTG